jgi:hypothetical protein
MHFFKRISKYTFLLVFMFVFNFNSHAQLDAIATPQDTLSKFDTTRIQDLSNQLSVWLYTINKVYKLDVSKINTGKHLLLSPNEQANIGFGFNYKWMGMGIAFKPPWAKNDNDKYGKTDRIDFQLNIFTRSFGIDFSAQYYKGYYVSNPSNFTTWDRPDFPTLPNLETLSAELSGYYFFNNEKFSYRAAYVRNEIQKKGAGSFILGGYIRYDLATRPEGFVPESLPAEVRDTFSLHAFITGNYGISIGYTYTFVIWKKFFINLSLVPGFGVKRMTLYTNDGQSIIPKNGGSARFISRTAIGYEHKYFYLGLSELFVHFEQTTYPLHDRRYNR